MSFLERYARGEVEPDSALIVEPAHDWPVVTLSSPTLMPPPPVNRVQELDYLPDSPSVMPVLLPQIGDTTNMEANLPPGVSVEALALLRQHGVAHDSAWLWRAGAYDVETLRQMLGSMAPATAAAELLRQYGVEGNEEWTWRATQYDIGSLGRLLAETFPSGFSTPIGGAPTTPSLISTPPTMQPLPQVGGLENWVKSISVETEKRPGPGVSLPVLLAAAAAAFFLL